MVRPEDSFNACVTEAFRAYRDLLARYDLQSLSREEIRAASDVLSSQSTGRIPAADIRFQAAATRLNSRKDISDRAAKAVLRELVAAEQECDQALWERDCHRLLCLSHHSFRMPRHEPAATTYASKQPTGRRR